jgi:putative molybdopterin biosynthesis protein
MTLLTVREAASLMAVSEATVYREISRRELPAVHVGRQIRVRPADLVRYLERGQA